MRRICAVLFLLMLLLTSCAARPVQPPAPTPSTGSDPSSQPSAVLSPNAGTVSFTDDMGRELELVVQPKRVAVLIGSFVDIWCLAGGKDVLAAATSDTWTNFDLGLDQSVTNLGSLNAPSLEALLACEPDLILASPNIMADVELCETFQETSIPTAYFEVNNFGDYLRMLKVCTQLTGCEENYDTCGAQVQAQVDQAIARQDGSTPKVLCIRAAASVVKVKNSQGNVLGEMLAALGCVNVADRDSSLLENLSLEGIIAADPDYIFAVYQGSDKVKAQAALEDALLSNPAWGNLRAVREGRFHTLDHMLYNVKPNARWGEAYEKLADILYPAD